MTTIELAREVQFSRSAALRKYFADRTTDNLAEYKRLTDELERLLDEIEAEQRAKKEPAGDHVPR